MRWWLESAAERGRDPADEERARQHWPDRRELPDILYLRVPWRMMWTHGRAVVSCSDVRRAVPLVPLDGVMEMVFFKCAGCGHYYKEGFSDTCPCAFLRPHPFAYLEMLMDTMCRGAARLQQEGVHTPEGGVRLPQEGTHTPQN